MRFGAYYAWEVVGTKTLQKIAVVAQIAVALIFVATSLLFVFDVLPSGRAFADNGLLGTLIAALAIVYLGLSAFVIYANFWQRERLRQVLLHCDSESATRVKAKIIKNIAKKCCKCTDGVKFCKTKVATDEKNGLTLTVTVDVSANNATHSVDVLRCMLEDAFQTTLGLSFNSTNFVIRKLNGGFDPNTQNAEQKAKTLVQQRELSEDIYRQPFENNCDCVAENDEIDENDENDENSENDRS